MSVVEIFKCILLGVLTVINTILFIVAIIGFLCFIANLVYAADIKEIFKSFMIGFGGLFFGMVAYDCIIILFERMFK